MFNGSNLHRAKTVWARASLMAEKAGLVYGVDGNFLERAKRAYKKNLADPGDCKDDPDMLLALAVAQAHIGMRPGWIPEAQALAVKIAAVIEDSRAKHSPIPENYPVQPLPPGQRKQAKSLAACGHCGLFWDDGISTSMTPAPSARCPFEPFHR